MVMHQQTRGSRSQNWTAIQRMKELILYIADQCEEIRRSGLPSSTRFSGFLTLRHTCATVSPLPGLSTSVYPRGQRRGVFCQYVSRWKKTMSW